MNINKLFEEGSFNKELEIVRARTLAQELVKTLATNYGYLWERASELHDLIAKEERKVMNP